MLTKLEIINSMLASTGTAPLTSNDTMHPSYIKASNKLDKVSAAFQGKGWWFNQAKRLFRQNTDGEVIVPSGAMHVDPTDRTKPYTLRGTRLYNLTDATFIIGEDVEVLYVENVPIPDLPPQAQDYLAARAIYEFYRDEGGSNPKLSEYRADRDTTFVEVRLENMKNQDINWYDSPASKLLSTPTKRRLPL